MKKVLIFPDFDPFGGTRTYFKNLIDFYHSYDCQIVAAIEKEYCDQDIQEFLTKNEVKIQLISIKYRKGIFLQFFLSIVIDLFLGVPIIVQEKPDLIVISTGKAGKLLGLMLFPIKVIYVSHSYPVCDRPRIIYRNPFYRMLLLIILNNQKRILTVSKFSESLIKKCWLVGEKRQGFVHFIYNFSILENNSCSQTNTGKSDVKKILTLAHVRWYKNPDIWYSVALKTIEKYHGNVEFLWAGDGNLLDTYLNKVKKDNIPQIKYLGFQKNVAELYHQSTIYFQPSLAESQGIAVVDAMMMGIPCIVSNAGGLPESVVNGETGYIVDPLDIDTMVEKILELLDNENLRKSMGDAGKEYYLNNFSHRRWIQEMKTFHEKLW
jgi:glycosyltransferase involved in cell wall biosynthesis